MGMNKYGVEPQTLTKEATVLDEEGEKKKAKKKDGEQDDDKGECEKE